MSTMDLWHCMLTETKNRAKQRMVLSDNVANNVVNRFMIMSDDCQRISKKVSGVLPNLPNQTFPP